MDKIKKLKDHQYAQAHVRIEPDGVIRLISYTTTIITAIPVTDDMGFPNGDYRLHCTGLYSRTTIKHIGWFMREYFIHGYYDIKEIAGTDKFLYSHIAKPGIIEDSFEWRRKHNGY